MENEVKEPAPKYNYISVEEYLEMDKYSENKLEYYDGIVRAMGMGASKEHKFIEANIIGELHAFLKDKNCKVMTSGMRVTVPSFNFYMYPDALIVCDELKLQENVFDTLLNPAVIFEVLSPSTRSYDKIQKFTYYQQTPTLKEFILIESKKRKVYVYCRQPGGNWKEVNAGTHVHIQSVNFTISIDDLYRNAIAPGLKAGQ